MNEELEETWDQVVRALQPKAGARSDEQIRSLIETATNEQTPEPAAHIAREHLAEEFVERNNYRKDMPRALEDYVADALEEGKTYLLFPSSPPGRPPSPPGLKLKDLRLLVGAEYVRANIKSGKFELKRGASVDGIAGSRWGASERTVQRRRGNRKLDYSGAIAWIAENHGFDDMPSDEFLSDCLRRKPWTLGGKFKSFLENIFHPTSTIYSSKDSVHKEKSEIASWLVSDDSKVSADFEEKLHSVFAESDDKTHYTSQTPVAPRKPRN